MNDCVSFLDRGGLIFQKKYAHQLLKFKIMLSGLQTVKRKNMNII